VVSTYLALPFLRCTGRRFLDQVTGTARFVLSLGGQNVLTARSRGVAVVDHDGQVVTAVEHGVGNTAGQTVVPETTVTHHRNRTLVRIHVQGGRTSATQAITHGGVTQVEGRQNGKQVTANVGRHVVFAQFALHQLQCGKDRTLGTAGTKPWRTGMDVLIQA